MKTTENDTGLFTRITITPETRAELDEAWRECTTNNTVDAYLDYLESKAKRTLDELGYPTEWKAASYEEHKAKFRDNPQRWLAGWRDEDMELRARDCRDVLTYALLVREARQRGDIDMAIHNAVRMQAASDRAALRPFEEGVMGRKRGGQARHASLEAAKESAIKCAEYILSRDPEINISAVANELERHFDRPDRRTFTKWIEPCFPPDRRRGKRVSAMESQKARAYIVAYFCQPDST